MYVHKGFVFGAVDPCAGVFLIGIKLRGRQQAKFDAEEVLIGIGAAADLSVIAFSLHEVLNDLVERGGVLHAERVKRNIGNAAVLRQHQCAFVIALGPPAGFDLVLIAVDAVGRGHPREDVPVGERRHQGIHRRAGGEAELCKRCIRVDLTVGSVCIRVQIRRDVVVVFHRLRVASDDVVFALNVLTQGFQVVRGPPGKHFRNHVPLSDLGGRGGSLCFRAVCGVSQERGEIQAGGGDRQRIAFQRVFLGVADIIVDRKSVV